MPRDSTLTRGSPAAHQLDHQRVRRTFSPERNRRRTDFDACSRHALPPNANSFGFNTAISQLLTVPPYVFASASSPCLPFTYPSHIYAPPLPKNSGDAPVVGSMVGPAEEAVPVRARGARLLPRRLRNQHLRREHRRQVLWHVPRRRGRVRRLPRRRCVVRPPSLPLASFLSLLPCLFLPFFLFLFLFDTRARARGTEPDGAHTG